MKEEERELKKGEKIYFKRLINEFKDESGRALSEIKSLKSSIIEGKDGKPSLLQRLSETETKVVELSDNIQEYYTSLFEGDSKNDPIIDQIDTYYADLKTEIDETRALKEEMLLIKVDILGDENETGLKDEIEDYLKQIEKLFTDNSVKQKKLFEEIEGLLKGASTVALAAAFNEHKNSFKNNNYIWMSVFILSLLSMMGLSIFAFVNTDFDLSQSWKYTLGNIPFIAGAVWLSIYASKQRSQNKRLEQEYAFKEDVAKIYYGLKKEIESLGATELGLKLKEEILSVILKVVAENPSITLENSSHNDKGPILEALSSISETLKSIKK